MNNCVPLVDYCRLLIVMHGMNNINLLFELGDGTCNYIYMYINSVANSVIVILTIFIT